MKSQKRREIQKKKNAKRAARDAALTGKGRKKTAEYKEGGGSSKYAQKQNIENNPRSPFRPVHKANTAKEQAEVIDGILAAE